MPHRAQGYHEGNLPKQIRCPDCGLVVVHGDTFEGGKPISAICPECNERLYFADHDPVFTHCNVCGKKLREPEEDEMGMCNDCGNMD